MASGKVHARVSRKLSWGMFIAGMVGSLGNPLAGFFAWLGCRMGIYLTPDQDVNHKTYIELKLIHNHNPLVRLFGRLSYIYWLPYAWLIPHRSILSHGVVIGTLIRVVYAFWWLILLYLSYLHALWQTGIDIFQHEVYTYHMPVLSLLAWWLAGLIVSDIGHWFYDTKFVRFFLRRQK